MWTKEAGVTWVQSKRPIGELLLSDTTYPMVFRQKGDSEIDIKHQLACIIVPS